MAVARNPFFELPNENPLTCHVFCITDGPANTHFSLAHFAQKVRNLCWMLKSMGHKVIYYGYESCDVVCDEKVIVMSEDILFDAYPKHQEKFGHIDINVPRENPEGIEYLEKRWTLETGYQVKQRYKKGDFFFWMLPMCGQRFLYSELKDLPVRHIEPSVGYFGACLPHKVFPSRFIRDFHYGIYHANFRWQKALGEESRTTFEQVVPHSEAVQDWDREPPYDALIPIAFDRSQFDFRVKKKDYFLCLARVLNRKGIIEAVEIAERLGLRLIVAGPGDFERTVGKNPSANIEVLGAVGPEERRDLLSHARGLFCLSGVHETFGMAAIEALLSGTVPIVANTGGFLDTVKSGYNGYRVPYNDINAGVKAVENIDKIDPYMLRDTGLRYSRERCALQFNAYMQNLDRVLRSDGKIPLTEPDEVNYEKTIEWPDGWMTPVDAAKAKKEKRDVEDL